MSALFGTCRGVVNVGLASFADSIEQAGGKALRVQWSPPAAGDRDAGMALARLLNDKRVDDANQQAFHAYLKAQPVLVGVDTAARALPGLGARTILHAGPPIPWRDMCGPMQGAIAGAIVYEGWAADAAGAEQLAAGGSIALAPCHAHDAVAPMAGAISPSMPVWIVENAATGRRSYSNMNEGLGRALRFGANDAEVLARLKWIERTLMPALAAALGALELLELKPLMAQALHMGDEAHNRNAAATALLLKRLAPALARAALPADDIAQSIAFIAGNDHFFLNLSMAACKCMLDAAHGVAASSLVTAMSRNGVRFGIRLSGTGSRWFEAPALPVDGLYFPGYGPQDAAADLGDSAITETAGLGGFAMAAAPAIVRFVGGTPADAIAHTLAMAHVTLGRNPAFTLPPLDFAGTPAGIDARSVLDTGIQPVINTGIAHRKAGVGQIGAGITRAPLGCFIEAVRALDASL